MYDDDNYYAKHVVCRNCRIAEIEQHVRCVTALTTSGYTSDAITYLDRLDSDVGRRVYGIVIARLSEDKENYLQVSDLRSRYEDSSH